MTPENREAARQARNRLRAAMALQERALVALDDAIASSELSDTNANHALVNEAAARVITATHRVCDKAAELAAVHRR